MFNLVLFGVFLFLLRAGHAISSVKVSITASLDNQYLNMELLSDFVPIYLTC